MCTRQIGNQIFDMVEAIAMRRQKQALDLYYDLLTLKEPPMRILFLIARQFNLRDAGSAAETKKVWMKSRSRKKRDFAALWCANMYLRAHVLHGKS